MITRFNFPTRIVFGEGALAEIPEELERLGARRPLLVTDPGLVKAGLADSLTKVLAGAGIEASVFDQVSPNPTSSQVDAGADAYREHRADCVIALGGGSPMDAAKGIRVRLEHKEPMEEYDDLKGGDAKITGPMPPMIAVPTTAGTGSEVSRSAVITVEAVGRKVVVFSPRLMPDVAVCDPEVTYKLPPRLTAETGMDAMSHSVEAFMAKGYHPMADAIALHAVAMVASNLQKAVENARDEKARRELLMASTMGAVAFQKGLGVVHSIAHPLSTVCGMSHGLANSLILPHAMRFNAQAVPERAARLAHTVGLKDRTGEAFAAFLQELAGRCGLPVRLSDAGVKEEHLALIVEKALEDGCHLTNPRPCDAAAVESIIRAAM